jgi:hypothetical protein
MICREGNGHRKANNFLGSVNGRGESAIQILGAKAMLVVIEPYCLKEVIIRTMLTIQGSDSRISLIQANEA